MTPTRPSSPPKHTFFCPFSSNPAGGEDMESLVSATVATAQVVS